METASLTFGSPLWLWALAALPLIAVLHVVAHLRSRALVARIVAPRLRNQLAGSVSTVRRFFRLGLLLLAFAGIILALARPQAGFTEIETKSRGRDVIIAIDTSRSMLATDVPPDRLKRAKLLAQDLIRLLSGDRVGLVAFAGSAFLQAPLTLDYTAVVNSLDELDTNVIPKGGTNLASAISVAETAFGKAEGTTRALVILTDGEELDADSVAAAKKAYEKGIRIFTVGIGSADGSLIPIRTEDGRQDFVRDTSGKPVQSKLDATRLQEIAGVAGGFFSILGPETAREIVQRGIEPLEQTETGMTSSRQPIEKYRWPLAAAIFLLVVWMLLTDRRRRVPAMSAALVLMVLFPSSLHADGIAAYNAGDFATAGKDFEQRLKTDPGSRELQFNSGTAAYKAGDFDMAVKRFTEALLSDSAKLRDDASYNLANSLVRRGEKAQDTEAKKTDWKSAIEHYSEILASNPSNKPASENLAIVKKLLEDLEKQQQQQKDDKQKQDQKKDDKSQDKKDQQKNDDQQKKNDEKKSDQSKDQQNKDQQDQNQQQNKDQQKQDQKGSDQKDSKNQKSDSQKDQQGNDQQNSSKKDQKDGSEGQPTPTPAPTPGEKKEGDLKSSGGDKDEQQAQQKPQQGGGEAKEEEEREGQMSAAQARSLLNSLKNEEEKVNLIQQPFSQDVLRDW